MRIAFFCLVVILVGGAYSKTDRIKLRDIQVLTLKKGVYTEGRRSRRVPQLACVGGTARCSYIPETVQCYNRGWDGISVNWECKADMDKKYSFGQLEVTCEGYDHPDDSYILAGSCGLEFSLNMANGAYQERVFKPPPYPYKSGSDTSDLGGQWTFLIIIILVVLYVFFYLFRSPRGTHEPSAPPPPPGFRPDYFGAPPSYDHPSSSSFGPSCGPSTAHQQDGPGFFSGFFGGGLLGYLYGRNSESPSYTRFDSPSSNYSATYARPHEPSESPTETKTGFATTKRR